MSRIESAHVYSSGKYHVKENRSDKGPVHEVRFRRIKTTVWENAMENGLRQNVTISRIYKDGNPWKDSTSFGRDDLPPVMKWPTWFKTGS